MANDKTPAAAQANGAVPKGVLDAVRNLVKAKTRYKGRPPVRDKGYYSSSWTREELALMVALDAYEAAGGGGA